MKGSFLNDTNKKMDTKINFKAFKRAFTFKVTHNLDELNLSIDAAFLNWSARVEDSNINIENFCEYVCSKDPSIQCKPTL